MRVTVTGASGFIGRHVIGRLQSEGHAVCVIGRNHPGIPEVEFAPWHAGVEPPEEALKSDAIVHLAGEPVAQRWTSEVKRRIRDSRVIGTRNLVAAMSRLSHKPNVIVSASAIGYYGDRGDEILSEASSPGADFLAGVCVDWERESYAAAALGTRVVLLRTGIALGREGGALKQMMAPFKAGVGGPVGSGKQWVSWIHVQDAVSLILHALQNDTLAGPVNATSPNPVRNADFAHVLGHTLGRPSRISTPAFALKLMFGEMAEAVLSSQRVMPEVATRGGFQFCFPELGPALRQILE